MVYSSIEKDHFPFNICYISSGNIPSLFAHTIQSMAMCDAFSSMNVKLELFIAQSNYSYHLIKLWYNIKHNFKINSIKGSFTPDTQGFTHNSDPYFTHKVFQRRFNKKSLVYTRCLIAAKKAIEQKIPTVLEIHLRPSHPLLKDVYALSNSPYLLAIITVCDLLKEHYIQQGICAEKICSAIHGYPSNILPTFSGYHQQTLKESLELPPDAPFILYTGSIMNHKGYLRIQELALELPHCTFGLIGRAPHNETLDTTYFPTNVRWLGSYLPHLIPYFIQISDMCLLLNDPNIEESDVSCPLKLPEYMIQSKPIVAFPTRFLQGFLVDRENVLFSPLSTPLLAHKIQTLLDDPGLSYAMGKAAYHKIHPFSWKNRAEKIFSFIKKRIYVS